MVALELEAKHKLINYVLPFYILSFFTILASLRHNVGTDFLAYERLYYATLAMNDKNVNTLEPGYRYTSQLFASFGMPFYVFLFAICIFMYFFIYKSIKPVVIFPCIALCVLYSDIFFYFDLSGMRQAMALALTFFSFKYVVKTKLLSFIFFVFLATLFHKTAILFLIAYPLINFFKNKTFYFLCIIMLVVMNLILSSSLFEILESVGYFRNVSMYVSESYNVTSINNYILGGAKRLLPIIVLFYFFRANKNAFHELIKSPYIKMYIFGLCFYLSTYYKLPDISVRLSTYFIMFNIIILPQFAIYFKSARKKALYVLIVYIYCIISIWSYVKNPYFQYQSILFM